MKQAQNIESIATRGYALPMRIIHWVMATMIVYIIIVGILMSNGVKIGAHYDYHRATGFLVLILIVVRMITRMFVHPPIPLHAVEAGLQRLAARFVHTALYVLLFLQPLLGWYATNAWGVAKIPFFLGTHLPRIAQKDRELGNLLLEIHGIVGLVIATLIAIHVSAALYHQFIRRDGVLDRMIRS